MMITTAHEPSHHPFAGGGGRAETLIHAFFSLGPETGRFVCRPSLCDRQVVWGREFKCEREFNTDDVLPAITTKPHALCDQGSQKKSQQNLTPTNIIPHDDKNFLSLFSPSLRLAPMPRPHKLKEETLTEKLHNGDTLCLCPLHNHSRAQQ